MNENFIFKKYDTSIIFLQFATNMNFNSQRYWATHNHTCGVVGNNI